MRKIAVSPADKRAKAASEAKRRGGPLEVTVDDVARALFTSDVSDGRMTLAHCRACAAYILKTSIGLNALDREVRIALGGAIGTLVIRYVPPNENAPEA